MTPVRLARDANLPGFLALAAEVEHWFGPMVDDPGFTEAVRRSIGRGTALVAQAASGDLLGALLFGGNPPAQKVHWLAVTERARGGGVGRALLADALARFVRPPAAIEVVTFGPDHSGAASSGARAFYERLDFTPAEPTDPGPEGGSRQVYRRVLA
ncbi:acetyltransferase [Streptomyces griseofuscus]|uniref:Acetyltransferase n=1 Tax=Streptomyces griseofuscus TaxID=146922 RepID=A0A7H1Q2M5_9ACTN|nr:GNAT family N-acetyltransferase [Streptomyces griseofuscus]QNT94555.1 acetyltransferase [Streptomyces griseofuscus]